MADKKEWVKLTNEQRKFILKNNGCSDFFQEKVKKSFWHRKDVSYVIQFLLIPFWILFFIWWYLDDFYYFTIRPLFRKS